MTVADIKNSPMQPFNDFISVVEAKELNYITDKYHSIFNEECVCGSEMMIRYVTSKLGKHSVTGVTCCNPLCPEKLVFQLEELFQRFKVKGIGPATCRKVVQHWKCIADEVTLAAIILGGAEDCGLFGAEYDNWSQAMYYLYTTKQSLGELIYRLAFPGLGSKFEDVFQGYNNIIEFAQMINKHGLETILADKSVRSETTLFYFCTYFPQIVQLSLYYQHTFTTASDVIYYICMSGKMFTGDGTFTKDQYLLHCKELQDAGSFAGQFELKATTSVAKADFVVASGSSTNKFKTAAAKESKEGRKILYSPDEFIQYMKGEV